MEKVHYKWIVGVGAIVIAILTALLFCKIDCESHPIMRFLSLTATILSIMLSAFSILFSWYSMTSSSQQWNNVTNAIDEMKEANKNIKEDNASLLQNVINVTRDVSALRFKAELDGKRLENNNATTDYKEFTRVGGKNPNNVVDMPTK